MFNLLTFIGSPYRIMMLLNGETKDELGLGDKYSNLFTFMLWGSTTSMKMKDISTYVDMKRVVKYFIY